MIVQPLSDLHLDSYFPSLTPTDEELAYFCNQKLTSTGNIDVFTIAGDLSHSDTLTGIFLNYLVRQYNAHVVFTYGNHDLYLIGEHKDLADSWERIINLQVMFHKSPKIHFLNGDYVDIDGIRFGGLCNWYDGGSRKYHPLLDYFWRQEINDFRYIKLGTRGDVSIQGIRTAMSPKDQLMSLRNANCDYLLAHVCPIQDTDLVTEEYRRSLTNGFFFSDDLNLLGNPKLRYLQFGHTHSRVSKQYDNFIAFNAAIGYKGECRFQPPQTITL
jgi:predicted phosphodiesterase